MNQNRRARRGRAREGEGREGRPEAPELELDNENKLNVPRSVEERFLRWCERENAAKEDPEVLTEFLWQEVEQANGKLLRKEEAEFFAGWVAGNIPPGGGYPIDDRMTFEDEGRRYVVIACGWTSELDQKGRLTLFAFSEGGGRGS